MALFNRHTFIRLHLCILLTVSAQQIKADWLTFGHDPQRSGWAREETKISPANAGQLQLGSPVQ